ncbi:MAG: amidohydrolase family protein [Planctomycetota bacterium]
MSLGESPHQPPAGSTLVEAHCHIFELGRWLGMLDLSPCRSAGDMLALIADRRRDLITLGRSPDIYAMGARPESWDQPGWPSLAELDRVTEGGRCIAWCFDIHTLMANSAALERADKTTSPGQPEGVVTEEDAHAVWASIEEPTGEERLDTVAHALDHLASLGYREAHDMRTQPWLPADLAELERRGRLPLDVRLYTLVENIARLVRTRADFESDRIALAGGKIFTDGTLNSRTALMLEPFADGPPEHPAGLALMSADEIAASVRTCDELGVPLAAHAIGDGAVRNVLDGIELAKPRTAGIRVEHCELVDEADIPRFAGLGLTVSMQPCHLLYDIESLQRAQPSRLDRVMPIRELIDSGLEPGTTLVFGSDAPVVSAHAGDSLQAAVERRRVEMTPDQAIAPDQAITLDEALACFGILSD